MFKKTTVPADKTSQFKVDKSLITLVPGFTINQDTLKCDIQVQSSRLVASNEMNFKTVVINQIESRWKTSYKIRRIHLK